MATIEGTAEADVIRIGDDPVNLIFAGEGDDIIFDGPGRDFVNGGAGFDTYVIDLAYEAGSNLTFSEDRYRLGGAEGDTAVGVERFILRDTVVLVDPAAGLNGAIALPFSELLPINDAFRAVLRAEAPDLLAESIAVSIREGRLDFNEYVTSLVAAAQTSTVPALLMQAAVFGTVPTSEKMDSLAAFSQAQFDYYKNTLQSASAELGPYEALGRGFSSTPEFKSAFSEGADTSFVATAYSGLFNRAPSTAQQAALVAQVDYFEAMYRAAGLSESQARLEARGAVYGQMVGYASAEPELGYGAVAVNVLLKLVDGGTSVYGSVFGS